MLPIFCGVATSFILFPLLRKRNTRTAILKFTISNFPIYIVCGRSTELESMEIVPSFGNNFRFVFYPI